MKWYYKVLGGHTHVRVFMNGGKCGDLCFRNEEFQKITSSLTPELIDTFEVVIARSGIPSAEITLVNDLLEPAG